MQIEGRQNTENHPKMVRTDLNGISQVQTYRKCAYDRQRETHCSNKGHMTL